MNNDYTYTVTTDADSGKIFIADPTLNGLKFNIDLSGYTLTAGNGKAFIITLANVGGTYNYDIVINGTPTGFNVPLGKTHSTLIIYDNNGTTYSYHQ